MDEPTDDKHNVGPLLGHSLLIGTVAVAWNGAHENVFRMFWKASGMPKDMAEAIFFSLRSDSGQRDITRAVCKTSKLIRDEYRQQALDALARLDRLAGERNAAIHTLWDDDLSRDGVIAPSQLISREYHNKNLKGDVTDQFKALVVEIMKAGLYVLKAVRMVEIDHASPEKHE